MSQERWWNWKDDDSTFRMAAADLTIIPFGLYYGFSPVLAAGMNLNLTQVGSGKTKVSQTLVTGPELGLWKSKQGVLIQENDVIGPLPVTVGDAINPRIDLIVGEHEYIVSTGGATALYKVIEGTPAAIPVAPPLSVGLENKQVILGTLYIPAATANLSEVGVEYNASLTPDFLNDNTIAHTNEISTFTKEQIIPQITQKWGVCFVDVANTRIDLGRDSTGAALVGEALAVNIKSNKFLIDQLLAVSTDITEVIPYPYDFTNSEKSIEFFTLSPLKLVGSNFIDDTQEDVQIYAFGGFKLTTIEGAAGGIIGSVWLVARGGEAKLHGFNNYLNGNSWNKTNVASIFTDGRLLTGGRCNYVEVALTPANKTIHGIAGVGDQGTILAVRGTGDVLTLIHDTTNPVTKPLWLPNKSSFTSRDEGEVFLFMEDTNYWRLMGSYTNTDDWHLVGETSGLGTVMTGWISGAPNTPSALQFRKKADGTVVIKGHITLPNIATPPVTNTLFTLPTDYIPISSKRFCIICDGYTAAGGFIGSITAEMTIFSSLTAPALAGQVVINQLEAWDNVQGYPNNYELGTIALNHSFVID